MPTVVRFLTILAVTVAVIYAAMVTLVWLVHPRQAEISERIQIEQPKPQTAGTPQ
jgi:hypothetical protein